MNDAMHPYPAAAVERTLELIRGMAAAYEAPALLCSWSKDSMVLRHIVRAAGHDWPIITYMTEWHPRKWDFARRMSVRYNEPIITYNPQGTWIYQQDGAAVLGSTYQLGTDPEKPGIDIHVDVIEPPDAAQTMPHGYECGLRYMSRLRGSIEWRWDAVLLGHRDVDRDRFLGALPLASETVPLGDPHPDLCFPLKHWTDREIWDYTMHEGIMVDWDRYSTEDRWGDPAFVYVPASLLNEANNDCMHACIRCLKLGEPATVHCPAVGQPIPSQAAKVRHVTTLAKPYFTPTD